jgi:hypothetical protein
MQRTALSESQRLDGMQQYSTIANKLGMSIASGIIMKPDAFPVFEHGLRAYR